MPRKTNTRQAASGINQLLNDFVSQERAPRVLWLSSTSQAAPGERVVRPLYQTMKKVLLTQLFFLIAWAGQAMPKQSETYAETRKDLLAMQRDASNKELQKLFAHADEKLPDLKKALYDPEKTVNPNAQVILKYIALPAGLAALEEWYAYRRNQSQEYWMPKITLVEGPQYLEGKDTDVTKLVLKNLHPAKDAWAKIIAQNKATKSVLIEVVYGEIFTEGWHVVIRQEAGKWRVLSNNLVWQS